MIPFSFFQVDDADLALVSTTPSFCTTSASWQFCMICMDGVAWERAAYGFGTMIPHRPTSGFEKNRERKNSER
jgi:hypothetical protein